MRLSVSLSLSLPYRICWTSTRSRVSLDRRPKTTSNACLNTFLVLHNAFNAFDTEATGYINAGDIGTVIDMLGHKLDDGSLRKLIRTHGRRESAKFDFEAFVEIAGAYVDVEEDAEEIAAELKEAFRLYDKEGVGYLTTEVLRDILHELDDKITEEDLDMMIDEIDIDGSGTVDLEGG